MYLRKTCLLKTCLRISLVTAIFCYLHKKILSCVTNKTEHSTCLWIATSSVWNFSVGRIGQRKNWYKKRAACYFRRLTIDYAVVKVDHVSIQSDWCKQCTIKRQCWGELWGFDTEIWLGNTSSLYSLTLVVHLMFDGFYWIRCIMYL